MSGSKQDYLKEISRRFPCKIIIGHSCIHFYPENYFKLTVVEGYNYKVIQIKLTKKPFYNLQVPETRITFFFFFYSVLYQKPIWIVVVTKAVSILPVLAIGSDKQDLTKVTTRQLYCISASTGYHNYDPFHSSPSLWYETKGYRHKTSLGGHLRSTFSSVRLLSTKMTDQWPEPCGVLV